MRTSNCRSSISLGWPILVGAFLFMLGCTDPSQVPVHASTPSRAQTEPQNKPQGQVPVSTAEIEFLGRATVGSKLSDVRSFERSENCLLEEDFADCTFTDSDGVSYTVLDDSVTTVSVGEATASSDVSLPYGLRFGDSLDASVSKIVARGELWTLGRNPDASTGIVLVSRESFAGNSGSAFSVELFFERNSLVNVTYSSGTI